jgi:hypothetical protein
MVLLSRYFNGGLLVTRTIHVVAALSGGGHDLDQVWSGLVSLITDPRQGADTPRARTVPPVGMGPSAPLPPVRA